MPMIFLWDCFGFSWYVHVVLWYFDGIPMASLWDFHKFSIVFLLYFLGFQKVAYGISMEFQWGFKGFPLDSYGVSTGILWDFHDMSIKF